MKNGTLDTASMKEAARRFGADLVGVAPIERFDGARPENDPRAIFPQAKTLLVVGRRLLRGSLAGLEGDRSSTGAFRHFGFMNLEDNYLAKTVYDLVLWIEARGFEAVPMFGYDVERAAKYALGTPVAPGKPAPNVYVDIHAAAAAAGLGRVGKNGLFLTPGFGPRQRFQMLLSDFAFEPDALSAADPCGGCEACLAACPAKALGGGGEGAGRDDDQCRVCATGAVATNFGRFHTVDRLGAACARACVAALEDRGLTTRPLRRKFRQEVQA